MQHDEKTEIKQLRKTVLANLFQHLAAKNIPYCILHAFENLNKESLSDIDLCISINGDGKLDNLLSNVCYGRNAKIIQKLLYDIPRVFYYVIGLGDSLFLRLDFLNDSFGINRYFLNTKALVFHTRCHQEFHAAAPEVEAIYLLIKRVVKGSMSRSNQNRLFLLYKKSPQFIRRLVEVYFGPQNIFIFRQLLQEKDDEKKRTLLDKLKKSLYFRQILSKPNKWPLIVYYECVRFIERVLRPSGIVVCILSPDGGGKSSVSKALSNKLLGGFRKTKCLHWRPGLLPQLSALFKLSKSKRKITITGFHNSRKQSRILSLVRWIYYTLDFILGYYLKLLPMKIRTTAIIMDRYYYDIMVDPTRYGFNLPNWLLEIILPIIPKPDLCIYLDNSAEVLHARKQELPLEELKRQIESWRRLIHRLPNACIITTDKPVDAVIYEATTVILNKRAEMTKKMLRIEPEESAYMWKSEFSKSYVALPSKKNCRWLIPTNPILAKKAWDLYLPYGFFGKMSKNAFRLLSSIGFFAQNRLTPEATEVSEKLRNCIEDTLKRNDFALAISAGTPGPYITAMIVASDGTTLGYLKLGTTLPAIERIKHEASTLKRIKLNGHKSDTILRVPQCLFDGKLDSAYFLVQSPPPSSGKSEGDRFNKYYADLLCTIIKGRIEKKKFIESHFCRKLKDGIHNYPLSFQELLLGGLQNLGKHIGNEDVAFALSHGDFTPWNILWNEDGAFIFDWESACLEAPVGIDLVHFLFQTGFLLRKFRGDKLLRFMIYEKPYKILIDGLSLNIINQKNLILCYLLKMAIDEDREQLLSKTAVERRNLIKLLVYK